MGMPASEGDWIAAFDSSGNCAGASKLIINNNIAYSNLVIYGDDPLSLLDEGIDTERNFSFMF